MYEDCLRERDNYSLKVSQLEEEKQEITKMQDIVDKKMCDLAKVLSRVDVWVCLSIYPSIYLPIHPSVFPKHPFVSIVPVFSGFTALHIIKYSYKY